MLKLVKSSGGKVLEIFGSSGGKVCMSEQKTDVKAVAHVTFARAKYFEHVGTLPKSEVLPSSIVFNV